jgi:hypothetical protein
MPSTHARTHASAPHDLLHFHCQRELVKLADASQRRQDKAKARKYQLKAEVRVRPHLIILFLLLLLCLIRPSALSRLSFFVLTVVIGVIGRGNRY